MQSKGRQSLPKIMLNSILYSHMYVLHLRVSISLRSWQDLMRECFCFVCEAMNASGEAVRGLVKSRIPACPNS